MRVQRPIWSSGLRRCTAQPAGGHHLPPDPLAGFLFLAVVMDVYSRRSVGWAMANHLKTALVLDALNMALWQRRPNNIVHRSDHGTQYTSIAFGLRCKEAGVRSSMGSIGDCFYNAMCESFFATLECELLDRRAAERRLAEAWASDRARLDLSRL